MTRVFIVTYAAWLVFEIVTGSFAEIGRSEEGEGPRLVPFSDLDDLGWDCAGVCSLLWRAASGDPLDAHGDFLLGIALMWAGIAFRYYAMRVLGRYFTFQVDVHSGQTVIEAGPVSLHPASFVHRRADYGAGSRAGAGKLGGILAMLACVGIGYAYRIHVEEAALVAALGRTLQGIHGTHAAAGAVCALAGVGMLRLSCAEVPTGGSKVERFPGPLNYRHRADLRQFLAAQLQLAWLPERHGGFLVSGRRRFVTGEARQYSTTSMLR